jgi:uncharacterized membrane protein
MTLAFSFLIGFFAGLRSLTAPATTAWAVYLGWLKIEGATHADRLSSLDGDSYTARNPRVGGGQAAANTQPHLSARFGCAYRHGRIDRCVHSCRRIARSSDWRRVGFVGGVVGCFAGYRARATLVKSLHTRDTYVALAEDLVAVAGRLWVVSRF